MTSHMNSVRMVAEGVWCPPSHEDRPCGFFGNGYGATISLSGGGGLEDFFFGRLLFSVDVKPGFFFIHYLKPIFFTKN